MAGFSFPDAPVSTAGERLRGLAPLLASDPEVVLLLADCLEALAHEWHPGDHSHLVNAFTGEMDGECRYCKVNALLARGDALIMGRG